MPQLHLYVGEEVAAAVKARARARGLSVSRYLAALVKEDTAKGWPRSFFEEVIGGWKGSLRRPRQGRQERREAL